MKRHRRIVSPQLTIFFRLSGDSVFFFSEAIFSKVKSGKKSSSLSNYYLRHEQGHFDITEIFRRKLMLAILERPMDEAEILKVYGIISAECDRFHDLYDADTDHARIPSEQIQWNSKIFSMLKSLEKGEVRSIYLSKARCKICWQKT